MRLSDNPPGQRPLEGWPGPGHDQILERQVLVVGLGCVALVALALVPGTIISLYLVF